MSGIFHRIFGRETRPGSSSLAAAGSDSAAVGASAVESGEASEQEYEEFCKTFHHKPGQRLMDYLTVHQVDQLRDWLHPSTAEAEPKAFIRLANDATRKGLQVWNQTGLEMFVHGRWEQGGGPSKNSQDCFSILAQILELPITIYYRPAEDAEMMFMTFEP